MPGVSGPDRQPGGSVPFRLRSFHFIFIFIGIFNFWGVADDHPKHVDRGAPAEGFFFVTVARPLAEYPRIVNTKHLSEVLGDRREFKFRTPGCGRRCRDG